MSSANSSASSKDSDNSVKNGADKKENTSSQRNAHSAPPKFDRSKLTEDRKSTINLSHQENNQKDESHDGDLEDDPCVKKRQAIDDKPTVAVGTFKGTPGPDPRFQQQNQTLRCFVMYNDFYRCEKILGEGHTACTWFREVFQAVCPNAWISHWDELREEGRFPWRDRSMY